MRSFIAIDIPEQVKENILRVSENFRSNGITLVKREALHVTLHFLGDLNDSRLEEAKRSMDAIKEGINAFDASLNGVGYFTPQSVRVIFAELEKGRGECISIYNSLERELRKHQVVLKKEDYTPHVTIARVRFGDRNKLLSVIDRYAAHGFGEFRVDSIKLKSSVLGSTGPAYTDLYELKF